MAGLDALIFDLDGTLTDSLADIGGAMNALLARHALPAQPLDAYRDFVGEGVEVLIRRAFLAARGLDWRAAADDTGLPAPLVALTAGYRDAYAALGHAGSQPYPGIDDLLSGLAARRIPMAVLSNKHEAFTRELVALRFGRCPFVEVRGAREGVPRKPDPTAALALAQVLRVPCERTGFVGDTPIDVGTARNAGMVAIAVTWGFRTRAELVAAGPRHLIDAPAALLDLVDG